MKKFLLAFAFSILTSSVFAICPQAVETSNPNFCSSFKSVATCHCVERNLPEFMCQDMKALYTRMISIFGSLQKACEYQKDTTTQMCIDDWNCYLLGGTDSVGRLCSSSGAQCL